MIQIWISPSWNCNGFKILRAEITSVISARRNTNFNLSVELKILPEFYLYPDIRERENSNLKTLFYKDCSLGSVKTCLKTSLC